jgi:putative ABC transport system permease protein
MRLLPLLRLARRDAVRGRGRTVLVCLLIALPVFAVTVLDTLVSTSDVSAAEGLDRRLGSADALVNPPDPKGGGRPVDQDVEAQSVMERGGGARGGAAPGPPPDGPAAVRAVLGDRTRLVPVEEGSVALRTDRGLLRTDSVQVDLADPVADGLYPLVSGRLPGARGEVAVSEKLAERGLGVGLTVRDGPPLRVVGTVRIHDDLDRALLVAFPGTLPGQEPRGWLVDSPAPVGWHQVRALNDRGLSVLSRSVVLDPPPASEVPAPATGQAGGDAAILAMVVAMALLQVVLLAGPAFAVGVRRQERTLALLAVAGGDSRHLRAVVLAGAVVIGLAASLAGAALGVLAAAGLAGTAQRFTSSTFGPFEVPVRDIAIVVAFGVVSALLAALAPARSAARQDVVRVLTGRRGQRSGGWRHAVVGLVLAGAGTAGCAAGAGAASGGEYTIAFAAVAVIVGAVLLSPAVIGLAGRLGRVLPMSGRLAVRDAARQRARTAPAVAAVAATVAGVVALAIGGASDAAENKATYQLASPPGTGLVQAYGADQRDWEALRAAVGRTLPEATVTVQRGLPDRSQVTADDRSERYEVCGPDAGRGPCSPLTQAGWVGPAQVRVGEATLASWVLPAEQAQAARRALRAGRAVAISDAPLARPEVSLRRTVTEPSGAEQTRAWPVPVVRLPTPGPAVPGLLLMPDRLADRLGLRPQVVGLFVHGAAISGPAEDRLAEEFEGIIQGASFTVERGYDGGDSVLVLLLLGGVGAVLVIGGTLTATLLALAEARPDFATLSAVGASPGVRRRIAASYAVVVGITGALLGTAAGFVPGIAVAFPLTGAGWQPALTQSGAPRPDVFIDVPWLLLAALVVGVPLMCAAGVSLATRGRLPIRSGRMGM